MSRLAKVLILCATSVVLVIGMAIGAFLYLFNPNSLKPLIEAQAYQLTGRQLTIAGDISWTLFPTLGVNVKDATLSNFAPNDKEPFIHLKEAGFTVKLKPLITQKIVETGGINVDGLEIHLKRAQNGKFNWQVPRNTKKSIQMLTLASADNNTTQSTVTVDDNAAHKKLVHSEKKLLKDIAIRNVSVQDAQIFWQDDMLNQRGTFVINSLHTKHVNLNDKPFPVSIDMDIQGEKPQMTGSLSLMTLVKFNKESKDFALQDSDLKLALKNLQGQKPFTSLSLNSHFNVDTQKQVASFSNIQFGLNDVKMNGKLSAKNIVNNPDITGEFSVSKFNPAELLQSFGITPSVDTTKVLRTAQGEFDVHANKQAVTLTKFHGKIDDSDVSGKLSYLPAKSAATFSAKINHIALDDYTAKSKQSAAMVSTAKAPASLAAPSFKDAVVSSVQTIQGKQPVSAQNTRSQNNPLQMQGDLNIGELSVNNIKISDVQMTIAMKNNSLQIKPLQASLYKGTFSGEVLMNQNQGNTRFETRGRVQSVQVEPLLKDAAGRDTLSGVLNLEGDFLANGADKNALLRSLNGHMNFHVTNGQFTGVDMTQALAIASAIANKKLPSTSSGKTTFGTLSGTMNIQNGLGVNDDLLLDSPLLGITGEGKVDFVTQELHYKVNVKPKEDALSQFAGLDKLLGGTIPMRITGTLDHPKVAVDQSVVQKLLFKQEVQDTLDKVKSQFFN